MGSLQFNLVTKIVEDTTFDCGISSINGYVKNSFLPLITQQAYTYSIKYGSVLLGYYQIMFREIELEDISDEFSIYDASLKGNKISSVYIRFLAIDKEHQRRKIGTNVIKIIIKQVETISNNWPVRIITIDGRNDLIDWYHQLGFVEMQNNTSGQDGTTTAMYYNCTKYEKEINEYVSNLI